MTRLHRWVRQGVAAAGLAATLLTTTASGTAAQAASTANATPTPTSVTASETIHTTANHPWLTTDRGWVPAGELHSGERIVCEDGAWQAGINSSVSTS